MWSRANGMFWAKNNFQNEKKKEKFSGKIQFLLQRTQHEENCNHELRRLGASTSATTAVSIGIGKARRRKTKCGGSVNYKKNQPECVWGSVLYFKKISLSNILVCSSCSDRSCYMVLQLEKRACIINLNENKNRVCLFFSLFCSIFCLWKCCNRAIFFLLSCLFSFDLVRRNLIRENKRKLKTFQRFSILWRRTEQR